MKFSVVVVSEYELIAAGVRAVLQRFPEQVIVLDVVEPGASVDVAVWSTFGEQRVPDFSALRSQHGAGHIVALCWDLEPKMVERTLEAGADGYLTTTLSGGELVSALGKVHAGKTVVSPKPVAEQPGEVLQGWPGREAGLSEREADIVALIASGFSNDQIAGQLFLSINTIKSYVRSAYRKINVSSRSQAVLWGVENGLRTSRSQHT